MPYEATSRHLKQSTELTLIAPIIDDFIAMPDVMSFATRLRLVLKTLFEIRRVSIERDGVESAGALERLRSLFDVRWALIDDDRKLLLAVTFDRSWESYIQGIVDDAGPLLDLIFSHCQGYANHHCSDGYTAFASWVRKHQVHCDFFYAGSPDLTVDDQRLLVHLARAMPGTAQDVASLTIGDPAEGATEASGYRALSALHDLKRWFPGDRNEKKSDRALWDAAARVTIPKLDRLSPASIAILPEKQWLQELQELSNPVEKLRAVVPLAPAAIEALRSDVQANILTKLDAVTHGLLALVRFDTADAASALIQSVEKYLAPNPHDASQVVINIGFTWAGMQRIGIDVTWLESNLPKEFREGMETRAGLLGDTGKDNSPECWKLPVENYPAGQGSGERFPLSAVDAVLLLQAVRTERDGDHDWSELHPLCADLDAIARVGGGFSVLHVHALRRYPGGEHFGFADATSQPAPDVRLTTAQYSWSRPRRAASQLRAR